MATTLFQAPCACVGACSVVGLFVTPGTGLLRSHIGKESACSAGALGWGDSLEEEMATHSSIYAWKIPWTEEPGWLQSMGLQRAGGDGAYLGSPAMPLGLTVPRTTRDVFSRGTR